MRTLSLFFGLLFSLIACAEGETGTQNFKAGEHYTILDTAVGTADPSKIEVAEVFWYGCPHCFKFEDIINPWESKLAADVNFVRTPAMWQVNRPGVPANWMELHARAYYSALALGVLDKMHTPLFKALNVDHKKLKDANELAELFAANGVDKAEFLKVFDSFGISSQIKQAEARTRGYRITGTPEMVVDGKYRISARKAGGQGKMLEVVDYLVEKIRAERSGS